MLNPELVLPEKSPLYSQSRFSSQNRQEIQLSNCGVILAAFSNYSITEGLQSFPLQGLNINGDTNDSAILKIAKIRMDHCALSIVLGDRPLCSCFANSCRDSVQDNSGKTVEYWQISGSFMNTQIGFEGNGFGTALMFGFDQILPFWADTLPFPSRVIALQIDDSRGAEQESGSENNYRRNWTSELLKQCGYSSDPETIRQYIGPESFGKLNPNKGNWIKLIRE